MRRNLFRRLSKLETLRRAKEPKRIVVIWPDQEPDEPVVEDENTMVIRVVYDDVPAKSCE